MKTDDTSRRTQLVRLRTRVVLSVVDGGDAAGFTLPLRAGPYRGHSDTDLACGRCGQLLGIGVSRRAFRVFSLPCPCGAVNRAL
jgi:hypothetical protein